MPYIYDSNGLLSGLSQSRRPMQARWVPMLDVNSLARKEDKQENYWAVGVTDTSFVCIILKGQEKFPFFPTPITQDLPLQLPLLNLAKPVGENEAKLLHASIIAAHARDCLPPSSPYDSVSRDLKMKITAHDIEMDKSLLKLILLACKSERQQQALDLAKMLSSSSSLQGAVRIGNLYSLNRFVSQVEEIQSARENSHGSSWREKQEKRKRDGKYAHLLDSRTIPDSSMELGAVRLANVTTPNLLALPFESKKRTEKSSQSVFPDVPGRGTYPISSKYEPRLPQVSRANSEMVDEPVSLNEEDENNHGHEASELGTGVPLRDENPIALVDASNKTRKSPFCQII